MQQTKRTSGVFVRNISQQLESTAPDKSTCKCDSKDLDRLKEVHLVSSRRQLFEENAEQFSENYYQNQNGNSEAKQKSAQTKKTEVNYDIHLVTPQRRSSRTSYKERQSKALDDHPQNNDDHNNNIILNKAQIEQDNVERYRSYVIKNIIDDFNGKGVDKCDDTEEDIATIQNCEDHVNKMMSDETRKSLDSLSLSLNFMQSLLGIQNKPQDNTPEKIGKEYQLNSTPRLSNEFKIKDDSKDIRDSSYFTSDSDSTSDCTSNERKDIVECSSKKLRKDGRSTLDNDEKKSATAFDAHEEATITDNVKRKPRLSRFNRLSLKKQKYSSDSSVEQQSDDEDDIFGSMISDNDCFLEVINADSGVILNKISLQRVCISNVLINAPQNSKQTSNEAIRISVDEEEINNEFLENNITTTVYYDYNSNPRIEKVIDENKLHVANDENLVPPPSPTLPNKRQNLIIKELLETEVTFIEGLRIIIEEYLAYFKEHPDSKYSNPSYLCSLFGNVEEMYVEAQDFYVDLLTCDFNIEKLAGTFLEHKNLFEVFVEYIKNKPTSQLFSLGFYYSALKERRAQLQEKENLDLESYLLTPIQRLGRYILFMENLQKVTKAMGKVCGILDEATDFLKRQMRRADTFVAAVSIGNSQVDLTKKGSFVAKETFNIKKKYKSVVFLFQDIVVFTAPNQQRLESYFYKDSIEMSDLAIRSDQEQPLTFNLRSFSKSCNYEESPHSFELEAPSEKVKRKWVQEIENLLWEQLEKCKAEAQSGETVYRKFNKAASRTNSSNHYKKKKQQEIPSTPSANNERQSVFYVEY